MVQTLSIIMTSSAVRFYERTAPFYEFSNFYQAPIRIDGYTYMSTEHYYQAQKFYVPSSPRHMEYFGIIATTDSPQKVFMLGNQKPNTFRASRWKVNKRTDERLVNDVIATYEDLQLREDWETYRIEAMRTALRAKFAQHESLRALLLSTDKAPIIEDSPRDAFWGCGKDGTGANWLGRLLEEVRGLLRCKLS